MISGKIAIYGWAPFECALSYPNQWCRAKQKCSHPEYLVTKTHEEMIRERHSEDAILTQHREETKMNKHKIAVIPGDGIGKEVVPEGIRVLEAAASRFGILFDWDIYPWSCETYAATGKMMPADGVSRLQEYDAIFLGAVGFPGVPDHISLWQLLLPIRRKMQQYINLRPVRMLRGMISPLKDRSPEDIDFVIVRENNEGEYSEIGGRLYQGTNREMAVQETVFSLEGVDRVMRYAFELASERDAKHVTSATKSNGIIHTMPFWDERFAAIAREFPDIRTDQYHIDILTANFVLHPEWFDVVVASNLFGDILSDLGPALAGSIAIAPSANLNPPKEFPSMFEPVHGSAPDIAGKGIANPIGQIWAGALMLDHLGYKEAGEEVVQTIEAFLQETDLRTPDMGGNGTTREVGEAISGVFTTRVNR